jgi:hypothetical protein
VIKNKNSSHFFKSPQAATFLLKTLRGDLTVQAIFYRRLQREAQRQQRENKKPAKVENCGGCFCFYSSDYKSALAGQS